MIVLLGKSKEKNTELIKLAAFMDIPCVCVNIHEKAASNVITPWNYYTHKDPDGLEKSLFWLDLEASPYWSFRGGDIRRGQIYNADELLAYVYFRKPFEDQCIDRIEWIRNDEVYAIDYYDVSGTKYAEAVVNDGSESIVKYRDMNGTPTVCVWTSMGFVAVKKNMREEIYENQEKFYAAFMKDIISDHNDDTVLLYEPGLRRYIPEGSRCVLFVTEQISGELTDRSFLNSLSLIITGKPGISRSIEQFHGEGESPGIFECGSIIDRPAKYPVGDALIVTRSQHIEHLQFLVEGLPELRFHIAAGTVMAPGLLEFDKYDNVSLYPNSRREMIMELMDKCAFYLDINHYSEYEGIVHAAQGKDRLVYAFDSTVHQRASMPEEHIYAPEEADRMIADINRAMHDPDWLKISLEKQRNLVEITDTQREEIRCALCISARIKAGGCQRP